MSSIYILIYWLNLYEHNIYFPRQYERAIRTYDGDDPLFPRLEYIKWLEQIYILVAPKSNLLLLVEETVQTFKNDPKYKQDPRFIQILINYVNIF